MADFSVCTDKFYCILTSIGYGATCAIILIGLTRGLAYQSHTDIDLCA